jgi:ABC-type transport system involved in cytochrome c biogenesis permease component
MRQLLWKEWHEQSWKLGFGSVVLSALAAIGLHSRIVADETMVMCVCFLGIALLPLLSSTGLVPAERAEGTLESLLALPTEPRKILVAKTAMGALLCAGPLGVAMVVSLLMAGQREMTGGYMAMIYVRSVLASLALFIWMLALTIQLPGETRGGLVALGILIGWMIATGGLAEVENAPWVLAFTPLGFVYGVHFQDSGSLVLVTAVQAIFAAGLWVWACKRLAIETDGGL